jgi:hypothetical protein
MMTRAPALLVGLVLVSIGLGCSSVWAARWQAGTDAGPSDEEYEVYSIAIKQNYVQHDTKLLVIEDRTFRYDFGDNEEPWKDKYKGLTIDRSSVEDYEDKNSRQSLLTKAAVKLPNSTSYRTSI